MKTKKHTSNNKAEENLRRLSDFNQTLINTIPFGMDIVDENGEILFVSENLRSYFGEDVVGKKCWDIYKDDKEQCDHCPLRTGVEIGETKTLETANAFKGRTFYITHTGMIYKGKRAVLEIFQDITERRLAEERLKKAQDDLEFEKRKLEQVLNIDHKTSSILELNHLVDFVIDKATQILEAEKCSLMLFDENSQELCIRGSKGLDENVIGDTRVKLGEHVAGLVAKDKNPLLVTDIEIDKRIARRNRLAYKTKSFLSVPIELRDKLVGVVNVADKRISEDIYENFNKIDLKILCTIVRQAAVSIENAYYCKRLRYLSDTDPITGIYNHRHFIKSLDQEIGRSKRYSRPLSLLMTDLDDFKSYNDTYGHLEGDLLLKRVSTILKNESRAIDVVCRYAGDEFVVILPETTLVQAEFFAKKILNVVTKRSFTHQTTLSIGIAEYSRNSDRYDLIMRADQALYQAKQKGKNSICSFKQ